MLNLVGCAMQAQVRIKLCIFEMLKWLPKYCQLHVLLNRPRPENEIKILTQLGEEINATLPSKTLMVKAQLTAGKYKFTNA